MSEGSASGLLRSDSGISTNSNATFIKPALSAEAAAKEVTKGPGQRRSSASGKSGSKEQDKKLNTQRTH